MSYQVADDAEPHRSKRRRVRSSSSSTDVPDAEITGGTTVTTTIYGAGAIGGLVGAYLAKAGEDVLLVDKVGRARRRHQRDTGSRISGAAELTVPVRALPARRAAGPARAHLSRREVAGHRRGARRHRAARRARHRRGLAAERHEPAAHRRRASAPSKRGRRRSSASRADWQGPGHIEHGGAGNIWIGEMDGRKSPSACDRIQTPPVAAR